MNPEIMAVLEPQEQIIWSDTMNKKVLWFYWWVSFLVISGISIFLFSQGNLYYDFSHGSSGNMIPTPAIGLLFFVGGLTFSLIRFFSDSRIVYLITNKRILIRSGIIGTDFNSLYFTAIKTINVQVSLLDKIFNTGTLFIDTGKIETVSLGKERNQRIQTAYDTLKNINNPYEVYQRFQEAITGRQENLYSGKAQDNMPKGDDFYG